MGVGDVRERKVKFVKLKSGENWDSSPVRRVNRAADRGLSKEAGYC